MVLRLYQRICNTRLSESGKALDPVNWPKHAHKSAVVLYRKPPGLSGDKQANSFNHKNVTLV
jgi:hypothetical protein